MTSAAISVNEARRRIGLLPPPMKLGRAMDLVAGVLAGQVEDQCYAASEAVYHLAGGKAAGLTPMQMTAWTPDGPRSHWFIRGPHGEIVDLTAGQFPKGTELDYGTARGRGFQTKAPSKAARVLIDGAVW